MLAFSLYFFERGSIVSCLFHRARNIAQGENIQVEDHLRGGLEGNGYPDAFVKMASRPHTVREPAEEPRATAFISYVAGLSEDVRRVCRRYNIRTVFQSTSTLRGQLTKVKVQDPLEKKSGLCTRYLAVAVVYIGEMKRALETRIKEHRAATRWGETEKSAIAEHTWGQQHPILWEETSVLDQAKNNTTLLIKEAVHIRLTDLELINRDEGVAIPECWQPVLDHATMTSSTHATPR